MLFLAIRCTFRPLLNRVIGCGMGCLLAIGGARSSYADAKTYDKAYAPLGSGLVSSTERPFRQEQCLNGLWQFQPVQVVDEDRGDNGLAIQEAKPDSWDKVPIRIPSAWNGNSYLSHPKGADFRCFPSYPKEWDTTEAGWLRRTFQVPANWKSEKRRVVLHFEAIAGDVEVRVNRQVVARGNDSFLPVTCDVTDVIKWADDNELMVGARHRKHLNVPGTTGGYTYPTGTFWGDHAVGIWQDVSLVGLPAINMEDVFVRPEVDRDVLGVDIGVRNQSGQPRTLTVECRIQQWITPLDAYPWTTPDDRGHLSDTVVATFAVPGSQAVPGGETATIRVEHKVAGALKTWSPANPNLYGLVVDIKDGDEVIDRRLVRFGWRQFKIRGTDFFLNDEKLQLRIEICHFLGVVQQSPRWVAAWYDFCRAANMNAVRLHGQPHPRYFLEMADEMGILVHDETAIWGSHTAFNLDSEDTWKRFAEHTSRFVRRDRNHASVFGWSVVNELFAGLWPKNPGAPYMKMVAERMAPIIGSIHELDPTRRWVSADGDGALWPADVSPRPTAAITHYGLFEETSKLGILWGVGEATNTYINFPKELSKWNGERAYESVLGRQEAVAADMYDSLTRLQMPLEPAPAMTTVYNITTYCLKPLPFGMSDRARAPTPEDGIRFGPYVEGAFGVQPERIGPYSLTLNPGYDPELPAFDPFPPFHAVRAAYAPGGPKPYAVKRTEPAPVAAAAARTQVVTFVGDLTGTLARELVRVGIPIESATESTALSSIIIVDGASPEADRWQKEYGTAILKAARAGATVFVWGPTRESLEAINVLLPLPIELTDRSTTALVPAVPNHVLIKGLNFSDLYFLDSTAGQVIAERGLAGPFVSEGMTLLRANDVDWRCWLGSYAPEQVRNVALFRSEVEAGVSGACLVAKKVGDGTIVVSTLRQTADAPEHAKLWRTIFANAGVALAAPQPVTGGILDDAGVLTKALVIGNFSAASHEEAFDRDFLGDEKRAMPKAGDMVDGNSWKAGESQANGTWALPLRGKAADATHSAAYMSFWVFSPRSDVLLEDPRGAKIDLFAAGDGRGKIWLNGVPILSHRTESPMLPDQHQLPKLSLTKGWNHFLVKVVNDVVPGQFRARLICSDVSLRQGIRSALEKPANAP